MAFRIARCEMDGDAVKARIAMAVTTLTMGVAEHITAGVARSYGEAGFNPLGGYWWARDPLGQEYRFYIEPSALDETDGF